MTPLERSVERAVVKAVRARGGMVAKLDAATNAGAPDRVILLPGYPPILVELKTETGRVRPDQKRWHEKAAAIGHQVYVTYGSEGFRRLLADVFPAAPVSG